jgi:pimeloyl-ACP methyl ester carboxylesterase
MTSAVSNSGYAPVNGLELYYEIHGASQEKPLIMLHGGLGTADMFAPLIPPLSETRQLIAVELQGNGHTADIDRPMSYQFMADDVAALIKHLGLESADVLGYSMGGGVALQTAIRHPEVVRRLVLISATCKRNGWYAESLAGMSSITAEVARTWVGTPMHRAYASVAPRPDDWPLLAEKTSALLRQDYDWSADLASMKIPTLIILGDADGVRLDHAVEMFGLLGGGKVDGFASGRPESQLAVLPNTMHLNIIDRTDLLMPIIPPFLDATPADQGRLLAGQN